MKEQEVCNSKDKSLKDKSPKKEKGKIIIGDVDELIFPDDEPYYISQR